MNEGPTGSRSVGATRMTRTMHCVAIIGVRNEALHILRALKSYVDQGIEAIVIDHASNDATLDICRDFLGHGLLRVEHLPWRGVFDLTAQLEAKRRIIDELSHEWIIHADADELLQSPNNGESLLDGMERLSSEGYSVINFEEFVFLPDLSQDCTISSDYQTELPQYYFFCPSKNRLMRAWRRSALLTNVASGGHHLAGQSVNVAPETFILRHYIALSRKQVIEKYSNRRFSRTDLDKGWHHNRINLGDNSLIFPHSTALKRLPDWRSVDFDRSDPKLTHYWEWR
jgi:glycosyltransferase involved in cell wall biosynthesis